MRISQPAYAKKLAEAYGMMSKRMVTTPGLPGELKETDVPTKEEERKEAEKLPVRSVIGKLWWLARISRPDIFCALHKCAMWQNKPSQELWKRLQRILQYVASTQEWGITSRATGRETPKLRAYCDASFASEKDMKSRIGYLFKFGGALISWESAVASRVVTSSTEAECCALTECAKEHEFLCDFIDCLGIYPALGPATILVDNTATISLTKPAATMHSRSKHFSTEFNFVKERVRLGRIVIEYVRTDEQAADFLTKNLALTPFGKCVKEVMGDAYDVSHIPRCHWKEPEDTRSRSEIDRSNNDTEADRWHRECVEHDDAEHTD
jgi:hypothetical protein